MNAPTLLVGLGGTGSEIVQKVFERATPRQRENIGFVIFDSPKDKDLDKDKYERFLKCLASANCGQIFLTGSDKDEESYINTFKEEFFLPKLSDDDKLLKVL